MHRNVCPYYFALKFRRAWTDTSKYIGARGPDCRLPKCCIVIIALPVVNAHETAGTV